MFNALFVINQLKSLMKSSDSDPPLKLRLMREGGRYSNDVNVDMLLINDSDRLTLGGGGALRPDEAEGRRVLCDAGV